MNFFQWSKYVVYSFFKKIISRKLYLYMSSSNKTEWIRSKYFRPKGCPEIYSKRISYFNFSLIVYCPLQILVKAKQHGIEPSLSRLIMNEISKGDNCIDIGANYGFISMLMGKSVGKHGHVYSFESDQFIYKVLQKNIDKNNLNKICTVQNIFISDRTSKKSKKIDNILIDIPEIRLIKIDTDGSDYECLCGSKNLIKLNFPLIIIEINNNGNKIVEKLNSWGYNYFYDQHYNKIKFDKFPPNLIANTTPIYK